jgi:hypothetical protein
MTRPIPLFTLFSVTTSVSLLSLFTAALTAIGLSWLAARQMLLPLGSALLAGTLLTLISIASDWLHQMGHARAAHATGYPMRGIEFVFAVFSVCRYPADEPPLSRAVHIRRALGGFWVNLIVAIVLAPYAMLAWMQGGVTGWVLGWTALFNLGGVFIAFLPLDIPGVFSTDGGILLRYWKNVN